MVAAPTCPKKLVLILASASKFVTTTERMFETLFTTIHSRISASSFVVTARRAEGNCTHSSEGPSAPSRFTGMVSSSASSKPLTSTSRSPLVQTEALSKRFADSMRDNGSFVIATSMSAFLTGRR